MYVNFKNISKPHRNFTILSIKGHFQLRWDTCVFLSSACFSCELKELLCYCALFLPACLYPCASLLCLSYQPVLLRKRRHCSANWRWLPFFNENQRRNKRTSFVLKSCGEGAVSLVSVIHVLCHIGEKRYECYYFFCILPSHLVLFFPCYSIYKYFEPIPCFM